MVTFSTCIWPFISTVTRPPPAEPVARTVFSLAWISPILDCSPWSCLNISNGLVAMPLTFHHFAAKNLAQQLDPLVDHGGLLFRLQESQLEPNGAGKER